MKRHWEGKTLRPIGNVKRRIFHAVKFVYRFLSLYSPYKMKVSKKKKKEDIRNEKDDFLYFV